MSIQRFPKVTVILKGCTYPQIRTAVRNLVGSRPYAVETTMNTPGTLGAIKRTNQEFGDSIMISAGVVLIHEETRASIAAGAAFLLPPTMLNKRILDLCGGKDVASAPGAFSPAGIKRNSEGDAGTVKVFPAARLRSRYLPDIAASLGGTPLMVVSGAGIANAGEYFAAGALFAGIASGISDKQDILNQSEAEVRALIQAVEEELRELEGDL